MCKHFKSNGGTSFCNEALPSQRKPFAKKHPSNINFDCRPSHNSRTDRLTSRPGRRLARRTDRNRRPVPCPPPPRPASDSTARALEDQADRVRLRCDSPLVRCAPAQSQRPPRRVTRHYQNGCPSGRR
jgi:hypothetical protein